MKGTYSKPYAKDELNFSLPLPHIGTDEVIICLSTGNNDIEIDLKGAYFRKTNGTATVVQLQIDVEELVIPCTGGVVDDNLLEANLDRNRSDTLGLTILKDDPEEDAELVDPLIVDRTGAINLARSGGSATKAVVDYKCNLDFSYSLKRNTDYIIVSSVKIGANDSSESILYGIIRLIQ